MTVKIAEPLIEEFPPGTDAESVFRAWSVLPHCLFLDSARRDSLVGRYSFVAADPFQFWQRAADAGDPLGAVQAELTKHPSRTLADLPPFQGGAAGLLSYDLAHSLERWPRPQFDEFQVPDLAIGFYDVVAAFDHVANRSWLISQGWPEPVPSRRLHRAYDRLKFFHQLWRHCPSDQDAPAERAAAARFAAEHPARVVSAPRPAATRGPLARDQLAPQFEVAGPLGLTSNLSRAAYLSAIRRASEYIRAGDLFQVNLAQRLLFPAGNSLELYRRLRERNPAPFAGYFDLGEFQVLSASPERFLQVHAGEVEARPIKGTRRRTARPEADLFAGDELQASEKDRAENVMIVDLLRNDLSRVCRPDSVRVTELCRLELYEYVQHLVSAVRGQLQPGRTALDLWRAAFPGGSITGAPKVRAMEIIAELEPTARGAYCGLLGYVGFDGNSDANILIRTITAGRGWWQFPVGGGIVAQSDPEREYDETWHKAEGLLRALV
ncbi:MAG TPA: anthranilate synthase component I family protein [Pirellulales bacterium]|jgi:para-aminobenzoate synthetase component 1|nr:anthranilate synthase component I family protein [Pirellulales bacterium]